MVLCLWPKLYRVCVTDVRRCLRPDALSHLEEGQGEGGRACERTAPGTDKLPIAAGVEREPVRQIENPTDFEIACSFFIGDWAILGLP